MLLKAALNGRRTRAEHPAVPVTPEEIAGEARAAVTAGAGAIHVHVRDTQGQESVALEDIARTLAALRTACPSVPAGVSTGAWIVPDAEERERLVCAWEALPDFASVNIHEAGAVSLAECLLGKGIGVEVGLWSAAAAELFVRSGLPSRCLRILLEPQEASLPAALANVAQMEAVLNEVGVRLPRLLHGFNGTAWGLLQEAVSRGYDTRTGLEDVVVLPDGSPAEGNGALVAAAVRLAPRPTVRR